MSEEKQSQEKIVLDLRKVYVNDLSIEVPHAPAIFQKELNPEVALQVEHEIVKLPEEHFYSVQLRLTVDAKNKDSDGKEESVYLIQISQGGVFFIQGLSDVQLHHALNVYCPSTLFPYVREAVSNALVRAGFPVLFLQPINFDALYQERLQALLEEHEAAEKNEADKNKQDKKAD